MRTSALFGTKNFGISKIYNVSTRTTGVELVRISEIFRTRGEGGSFFCDCVRMSFMEGPLLEQH